MTLKFSNIFIYANTKFWEKGLLKNIDTPGRHKHIREDSLVLTPFVNNLPMKRCCNCEKSRCIKLYCECYANGVYCDGCNCVDCLNTPNHEVFISEREIF